MSKTKSLPILLGLSEYLRSEYEIESYIENEILYPEDDAFSIFENDSKDDLIGISFRTDAPPTYAANITKAVVIYCLANHPAYQVDVCEPYYYIVDEAGTIVEVMFGDPEDQEEEGDDDNVFGQN